MAMRYEFGAPTFGGFDGIVMEYGTIFAIRDGAFVAVERVDPEEGGWELFPLIGPGVIRAPTTLAADNFSNFFVVESQFNELFDENGSIIEGATGTPPFFVYRIFSQR